MSKELSKSDNYSKIDLDLDNHTITVWLSEVNETTIKDKDGDEIADHLEVSNNYYVVVDLTKFDTKNIDKVKKLAKQYDWYTMFIDDLSTMNKKDAENKEIIKELKALHVEKLILNDPKATDKWMQKREVHVKWS